MAEPMTDPQIEAHDEPDLEAQVEGLLSEVMETVEEIHRKLGDTSPIPDAADPGSINPDAPVGDDGAAEPDTEPDPAPEPEPEAALAAALGEPAEGAIEPGPEPDAGETSVPGIEDVQAALEAAIAEEAPAGEDDADGGAEPVDNGYADADALDDELAALASLNLDEAEEPEPVAAFAPEGEASIEAPESFDAPAIDEPDLRPERELQPEPHAEPVASIPDPVGSPAPPPRTGAEPGAGPKPGPRRGWLPAKPAWGEVYSRWRPVIIAYRYLAWIVPPLAGLVAGRLLARAKAMEPSVRHAVAVAASPLSRRDARVRSAVGYLAVWTLFWSVCLWIYVLTLRTAEAPATDETPTRLVGERAVSSPRN
jgi:hypothetical protein